ncbi:MAG TPA: hypothetical protein VF121_08035 [Thermoanaerobaculia bacterium]|nr:hypothetical protein [Thermoanaerobaculia bacterium]
MERTVQALAGVLDLAREMSDQVDRVDLALPPLRRLLASAGVAFRLVGGVAVVHHGYVRTTRDVDVLLDPEGAARLDPLLAEHGFERVSANRLRHRATGVDVDLLVSGEPMPRPGSPPYPSPESLPGSPADPEVVGLPGLLQLKLHSARRQDLADVVALLKPLDDGEYLRVEATLPADLRPQLAELRRDAIDERSWELAT